LGRADFWKISYRLHDELAAFGMPSDDAVWSERQLKFLRSHTYFTATAKRVRQPGKEKNMLELQRHLEELLVSVK
jgi:uncharacterized protein